MSCLIEIKTLGGEVNYVMTRLYPGLKLPQCQELTAKKWKQVHSGTKDSVQSLSCVWLCDPMDPTPGFPVHHQLTPEAYLNSCPLSRWWHPTISSSVVPFSFLLRSFPASGFFSMSQSALCIRWPTYWSFSFSISPSSEYSGLISFRMGWFDD